MNKISTEMYIYMGVCVYVTGMYVCITCMHTLYMQAYYIGIRYRKFLTAVVHIKSFNCIHDIHYYGVTIMGPFQL